MKDENTYAKTWPEMVLKWTFVNNFYFEAVFNTVYVVLPKQPINQFEPIQQRRQQELKAYCFDVYTVKQGLIGSN